MTWRHGGSDGARTPIVTTISMCEERQPDPDSWARSPGLSPTTVSTTRAPVRPGLETTARSRSSSCWRSHEDDPPTAALLGLGCAALRSWCCVPQAASSLTGGPRRRRRRRRPSFLLVETPPDRRRVRAARPVVHDHAALTEGPVLPRSRPPFALDIRENRPGNDAASSHHCRLTPTAAPLKNPPSTSGTASRAR